MDTANTLLIDAFSRVRDIVHETVEDLAIADLTYRAMPSANSIAWLIWHLTRIQDDHLSKLAAEEQQWTKNWYEKFELPFDRHDTGYGHSVDAVAHVRPTAALLTGYFDAVHEKTISYLQTLTAKDYDKIVDTNWDPPVTQAVRLISVLTDDLQHAGQAAYIRGLLPKSS